MALLTAARNTPSLGPTKNVIPQPVEAATLLYVGGAVALDANGYVVPAQVFGSSPLNALRVFGVCSGTLYATPGSNPFNVSSALIPGTALPAGAAGAIFAEIVTGVFLFDINGSSITQANVGAPCYFTDDHTVDSSSDTGARPPAGIIMGFEPQPYGLSTSTSPQGVWVDMTKALDIDD